jgi:hypothetical protein
MTAQAPERLFYENQLLCIFDEPLLYYWASIEPLPQIVHELSWSSTNCYRGYIGFWTIDDDRLYLIHIDGVLKSGEPLTIQHIFPNATGKVLADWYSGVLRCPRGERLKAVNMGYESIFEEDLLITVEKGVVKKVEVRKNEKPPSDECS